MLSCISLIPYRFDELSVRSFLGVDPNFYYCHAEECNYGQIHGADLDGNIFRCGACGFRICTFHDVPFHTDETCDQYTERMEREEGERQEEARVKREQEEASLAEVSRTAVECPGCGSHIHKTLGCDHMTCEYLSFHVLKVGRLMSMYRSSEGMWIRVLLCLSRPI
jgi:predicted RNA-binding Zn-ribbon protein involved in translation (DUF1610 family)